MSQNDNYSINYDVIDMLIASRRTISTMESCTGGLLASAITDRSGASDIFSGAYVTYSNEAKIQCGVNPNVIEQYGVYSLDTAKAMADACVSAYASQIGVGITGSLGRIDPRNSDSVSGVVYYCISYEGQYLSKRIEIPNNIIERHDMKVYVINEVLAQLKKLCEAS